MVNPRADIIEDILEVADRGESVDRMQPMLLPEDSRRRGPLTDLSIELAAKSAGFRRSLPSGVRLALADLVRAMNCYYSNLIEGHDTHPVDIERALKDDYSPDPRRRELQLEARAHIAVQRWIDEGHLRQRALSAEGIRDIHLRFYNLLPEQLQAVEELETQARLRVVPGELRRHDVQVGRHFSISPGAIPRFLKEFERVYSRLGTTDTLLSAAAAHHRLLWIHPFLDGNGRVARLMSHAVLLETLDTGGIWSVARGFARNVAAYKRHLGECDLRRRDGLDGRGRLNEEGLIGFTRYFLETCLDQIHFMDEMVQPERLRARILIWAQEETQLNRLPAQAVHVLEAVLYRGMLPRGEVAGILGLTPRHGRRIVSALLDYGVLTSEGPRDPLFLSFPAALASRWMPGLFPERDA
jgi:Fic family protein